MQIQNQNLIFEGFSTTAVSGGGGPPPPSGFTWAPATETAEWVDMNGGHVGNLANFQATADIPTLISMNLGNGFIVSASNWQALPALQVAIVSFSPFTGTLDLSNLANLIAVDLTNSNVTQLDLTGITSLITILGDGTLLLSSVVTPDLASVSGAMSFVNTGPVAFSFPSLTSVGGNFDMSSSAVVSVSCPVLGTIAGSFNASVCLNLVSVSCGSLVSVGGEWTTESCASLTSISLPVLASITGQGNFKNCAALGAVSLPDLATVGLDFTFDNNTSMTGLTVPSLTSVGGEFQARGTGLLSFSAPALATIGSGLQFDGNSGIVSLAFASLTSIGNDCNISSCPALTSAAFAALASIGASLQAQGNAALTALTTTNLATVGLGMGVNSTGLTSLSFPVLTSVGDAFDFSNCPALTSFSAPNLTTTGASFVFTTCPLLTVVTVTSLNSVGVGDVNGGGCTSLLSLDLSALITVGPFGSGGNFILNGNTSMVSLLLGAVDIPGDVNCNGCSALTTLTMAGTTYQDNGATIDFRGCALSVGDATHGVDGILARGIASPIFSEIILITGGTNANPSVGGLADQATLCGAGNTVQTNASSC